MSRTKHGRPPPHGPPAGACFVLERRRRELLLHRASPFGGFIFESSNVGRGEVLGSSRARRMSGNMRAPSRHVFATENSDPLVLVEQLFRIRATAGGC